MMRLDAIRTLFPDLELVELTSWIERRWVQPEPAGEGDWTFHEIDVARVSLIYDLRRTLDVTEEAIPLVLSLLDQLYELRSTIKAMMQALDAQPPAVKEAVLSALERPRENDMEW
jgi:chaperone modulatory protein CbpM